MNKTIGITIDIQPRDTIIHKTIYIRINLTIKSLS